MTNTLLNIAGKVDPRTVAVLAAVAPVLAELGLPYVVVGATARDLVLHYAHGARIQRATQDVDFAIELADWAAFETLKGRLCDQGFSATSAPHRLLGPDNTIVDIVPFGEIEDAPATLAWPPDSSVTMNVLGFSEACATAEWIRIQDTPALDIPVAIPEGMMLLKLIAWTDRPQDRRSKDALDIAYLLASYEKVKTVEAALYDNENAQIMETYDWDLTPAAAHLLGQRARGVARPETWRRIAGLAQVALTTERLVEEMCEYPEHQYARNEQLLMAFLSGFCTRDY